MCVYIYTHNIYTISYSQAEGGEVHGQQEGRPEAFTMYYYYYYYYYY